MSKEMPCKNCLTLSVCKARIKGNVEQIRMEYLGFINLRTGKHPNKKDLKEYYIIMGSVSEHAANKCSLLYAFLDQHKDDQYQGCIEDVYNYMVNYDNRGV